MKKYFILILALSAIISCKDKKNQEDLTPKVKENFSVELDVVVAKKDDFALYYTEDNTVNFEGDKAIWRGVNAGNIEEKIVFDLSGEKMPTDIRLDFGLNKAQDSVEVKNIKIVFYGNEMKIKGSEFFNWFIIDEKFKSKIDATTGSIKFLKSGDEWVTPFYYPRQELKDALKKLTTQKA